MKGCPGQFVQDKQQSKAVSKETTFSECLSSVTAVFVVHCQGSSVTCMGSSDRQQRSAKENTHNLICTTKQSPALAETFDRQKRKNPSERWEKQVLVNVSITISKKKNFFKKGQELTGTSKRKVYKASWRAALLTRLKWWKRMSAGRAWPQILTSNLFDLFSHLFLLLFFEAHLKLQLSRLACHVWNDPGKH